MRKLGGMVLAACVLLAPWAQAAQRPLVAVVFAQRFYRKGGEGKAAKQFLDTVTRALDAAAVPYARLKDTDVEAGRLAPYKFAIFPYSSLWPAPEVAAIERFVGGGGKIMVFYNPHPRLHALVGSKPVGWSQGTRRHEFASIKLHHDAFAGLPPSVRQDSWNITKLAPAADDAKVLGEWVDPDGKPLGEPAIVVSPRGACMGHVLTGHDPAGKGKMLLAIIGHLAPEMWQRVSDAAVMAVHKVGPFTSIDRLAERVAKADVSRGRRRRARRHLATAQERLGKAVELMHHGKHTEAIATAHAARAEAVQAFVLTSPERRDEFRATWIHTAYGVKDWGWRRSIRHLRRQGFNAIVPNMLWGGLAHYPSKLLPVSKQVAEKGDQIAECLRWCRRYGVELHVWKVNYNLSTAPKAFVDKMRTEGRLQRHRDGSELKWLCPSDPRNIALERDSMLEVVRNYDVHGIHFDYIRYPHSASCFCDGCRRRFEAAAGVKVKNWPADVARAPLKATFTKWRQDQITRLVREVSAEAHRIRPGVQVSAAVFGSWSGSRYSVGQDWVLWLKEGLLDFVCPMDYTQNPTYLERLVTKQAEWVAGRAPLYVGIGSWRIGDAAGVVDQLERARRLGGDGFVCFHYNSLTFTNDRMPAMHASHTAHRTRPPHPAPKTQFGFPVSLASADGLSFAEGIEIPVAVMLSADVNSRKPVRSASGRLYLETTDGTRVARFGRVRSRAASPLKARLAPPPGRYRLVVRGTMRFGGLWSWLGLSGRSFVVRSRPFEVVSRQVVATEKAKSRPPVFAGKGLRVGVTAGGYGSEALLAALKKAKGIDAMALHQVNAEFLKSCQVVVLAQPRAVDATTSETAKALRGFVAAGGGLLATHDAPGYRTHPVLVAEVCRGADHVKGTTWRATAKHVVTTGLAVGKAVGHSYYDYIALGPGAKGTVVAEGIGADGTARPTVVAGQHGKGRYVGCGLALGLGAGDAEREPDGAQRRLLLNAVHWLGGR